MTNEELIAEGRRKVRVGCASNLEAEMTVALERLTEVSPAPGAVAMREAITLLRDASYQNHTGHFDKTGGSGSGCPECIRARDLRDKADAILRALPAPEVPE